MSVCVCFWGWSGTHGTVYITKIQYSAVTDTGLLNGIADVEAGGDRRKVKRCGLRDSKNDK